MRPQIKEGVISQTADLFYAFRFLKLLTRSLLLVLSFTVRLQPRLIWISNAHLRRGLGPNRPQRARQRGTLAR